MVRFWQRKKKNDHWCKKLSENTISEWCTCNKNRSLPYNNFKTLKILFRFPRAKVNSNKIFKPSGWIKPSSLEQNKRKEIQLHDKDVSLMAHIKYSKDEKIGLKNYFVRFKLCYETLFMKAQHCKQWMNLYILYKIYDILPHNRQ